MDKISYYRDRRHNYLVATIQGFVTRTVRAGLRGKGFRYDYDSRTYRAPYSENAESYLSFLEKVCKEKEEEKQQKKKEKEKETTATAYPSPSKPKKKTCFELFMEGVSIHNIAIINGIKESTVYGHLIQNVADGQLDYHKLMSEERFLMLKDYLVAQDSVTRLKPLKEAAPFEVDYWEIILVLDLINKAH